MKNKSILIVCYSLCIVLQQHAQNTFSPYSRYAIGELAQPTFAHNTAMGGAFVALKQDSTMPNFINVGNPASYSLIRLATLELGINMTFSEFKGPSASSYEKTGNFAYGALGFPVGRRGGASFGIMPYTYVGSNTANAIEEPGIGEVNYQYQGSGGLNKIFLGYGVMPFNRHLVKFRRRYLYVEDTLKTLSRTEYKFKETVSKLLSDFALGANGCFIKGNISNVARVVYPDNSLYYNTYRDRIFSVSDVTANFGFQTAYTIDSVKAASGKKRALNDKVKFTFGYTFNLSNSLNTVYTAMAYNYRVSSGNEFIVDTIFYKLDEPATVTLPFEQGFGIGFKKGEKLNIVADYAITKWQNFRYLDNVSELKQNQRFAIGAYIVPEKYAVGSGSFFKRVNYRMGANYQTGYIQVNNTLIKSYGFSAGVGLPVGIGRLSSMVHLGATYGKMGTSENGLIMENFWRINIGFTFSDKWFQKYRYD